MSKKIKPKFEIVVAQHEIIWSFKVKPGTAFPKTYTDIIDGLKRATEFYELEQRTKGDTI